MGNIFTKHLEEEEKKLWLEDLQKVEKPVVYKDSKTIDIADIHFYKSQEYQVKDLEKAQIFCKSKKGVMSKLVNEKRELVGYLVQWQDRKKQKHYNEFNYKQLRRELDGA